MNFIIKNETPDFFEKLHEELDKSFSNCLIENWKVIKNLFKVTPKTNIHMVKAKRVGS